MSELKVIPLKCPNCGAKLEVSDDMDRFACGYCGTELIAQRKGGTIALKPVTDAIAKVQVGTDKTAAELALRRFQDELNDLKRQRKERNKQWDAYEDQLTKEYLAKYDRRMGIGPMILISGAAFLVVNLLTGNQIIVPIAIAIIIFVALFLYQKREDDTHLDKYDKLIAAGEAVLECDLASLDEKTQKLTTRIQQKKLIADDDVGTAEAPTELPPTPESEAQPDQRRRRRPARGYQRHLPHRH